mmetsp:Transcript_14355/g.23397  ORF Transcript_14355/g.23397 Transcript_14355/m.23397 type:complete len:633 (+) Transcript_14355:111-2009(+)
MADSFEHFCQTFDSFFRQDDEPARHNNVTDDEKTVNKTGDLTEETTSSSFMCDPSTSFTSWLSSQDFNIAVPSVQPDSPHVLGMGADDETYLSEELRHNDGTSPEETYDGSKPFAEWLSSRDAEHVVVTPLPPQPQRGQTQFDGLMFQSAHEQYEGGNKNISQDYNIRACIETNAAFPATMLNNIGHGKEVARIISETCGCTIITQLNDLLDTRHCDGDVQDDIDDNHHQDEMISDDDAVEVPLDIEAHDIKCCSNEVEMYATERDREDMEEICLNDSFEASLDDVILHGNKYGKEANQSEKEENDNCNVPAVTPEKQLSNGGDVLCAPERKEEDFPMDEMNAPAVTPSKSLNDHPDDAPRKKLSQMLLDSSLFQPNNNEWSSCFQSTNDECSGFQPTNDAWSSGCSIDGEDINTVDLESLDDALNDHGEIFRETISTAPPSLSQEVHLLACSFAASSTSSDHGSIFERVFHEENRTSQIADVDVTPLKKVVETRESFLNRTQRREDNHSRRLISKDEWSKGSKPQSNPRIGDHHSRLSSVGSKGKRLTGRATNSREDGHSRRSSASRGEAHSQRGDNHSRRSSSSRGEEEPQKGKENTIIVMSIKSRRGKDKYARHARKQRIASKAARLPP